MGQIYRTIALGDKIGLFLKIVRKSSISKRGDTQVLKSNMKSNKFIHIFFISAIAVAMSACVPKATEKKAVCGTNQAFNSVTRSCYSVVEGRTRPVGTKNSDTLLQEVAKTIALTYTDGNNNTALSCKVSSISANIEAVSPRVLNGDIFTKADLVFASAQDTANALPFGALRTAALLERDNMKAALDKAKTTFTYSNLLNELGLFETAATSLLTTAHTTSLSDISVKYYYDLTQARMVVYSGVRVFVDNRCDCTGGVCTTSIAPRILENGAADFRYTISDTDGEGEVKVVSLSITANAKSTDYLKPAVESNYLSLNESNTSTPATYSITLPDAHDYFNPQSSFTYDFNGTLSAGTKASSYGLTTNGKVYGCMGLIGSDSTGAADKTCSYIPTSGDANETTVPLKAQVTIDDLVFSANKEGTYGNNYTIQYFDLQNNNLAFDSYATKAESFGLVSTNYSDTFVRVVGNSIKIFMVKGITTSEDIKDLINSDLKAKALVTVTGGSTLLPDPAVSTPSALGLGSGIAGSDAFDKISYTANNGYATTANNANVMVKMVPVEDAPYWTYTSSANGSGAEDSGPIVINFATTYGDAESNVDACDIHIVGVDPAVDATVESLFLANFSVNSCTCVAGVCSASVTPNGNVSSTTAYSFYYRIGSAGVYNTYREGTVSVTPVNDEPTMAIGVVSAINENTFGYTDITVDHGGATFESTQSLSMTLSSNTPAVVPNVQCQNYTPGTGSPSGVLTPASSAIEYYFDMTNKVCYVSTGVTSTSWALYPSLTAIPKCNYESTGKGVPALSVVPTAANKYYLDTANNKCYRSNSSAAGSWVLDNTLTNFYAAYVPLPNQSAVAPLTISVILTDSGGTLNVGDDDSLTSSFALTVNAVDNPPFFILPSVTKADTNEGGMVVAGPFKVDEDEGSSTDENANPVTLTSIVSDNPSVLPDAAITIFYDLNDNGVEDAPAESRAVGAMLEALAGDDSVTHNFYLKLKPIAGVSGNANIEISAFDGLSTTKTYFSLIVHPIAALHGGWADISAVGIKTDKNGAPASDADVQCNYNKSNVGALIKACDSNQDCTGIESPNASVIPDETGVLYWDSANKKCYRSTGATIFSWEEFKTTCPVTRTTGLCSSQNCITSSAPTPTAVGQYYYNTASNICYISTGTAAGNWIAYTPAKVSLTWNAFTVSGSGAEMTAHAVGWNVYRREKGQDYDFKSGFLKNDSADTMSVDDAYTRNFIDKTAVAGKVYYYLVRPVDSTIRNLTISTPEKFSEVRVVAPVENYAFIHRWMVNQEVCNSMHMTTSTTNKVDPTKNFRCPYEGPGQVASGGVNYYDIGKDLLVDISEAGCPYTKASETATVNCTSNGCIDIGDPTPAGLNLSAPNGSVYYDRSAGSCWYRNAGAWVDANSGVGAALMAAQKVSSALNPPLVNISKTNAQLVCTTRTVGAAISAALSGAVPVAAGATLSLPSKKEYMAYSAAPYLMDDSTIESTEQGFSLNGQSRCNSSNANGIDAGFTNSSIPSTSFIYSLPGTASSGIRSLYTGSVPWGNNYSTESCSSRYGVQDIYGNVAEWVKDSMTCNVLQSTALSLLIVDGTDATINVTSTTGFPATGTLTIGAEDIFYTAKTATTFTGLTRGANATTAQAHAAASAVLLADNDNYVCQAVGGAAGTATELGRYNFVDGTYVNTPANPYSFDLLTGPYVDNNNDGFASVGDSFLTSWEFYLSLNGAGKFNFPMGMPMYDGIASTALSTSPAIPFLLQINYTAGITKEQLHEDGIIVNGANVNDIVSNPTQTGSFAQGGSYLSGNRAGRFSSELVPDSQVRPDIGFRCYFPIDPTNIPADTGFHSYSY